MMPGNKSTKILPNQMATKNFGKLKMQAQYRPNLVAQGAKKGLASTTNLTGGPFNNKQIS